MMKVIRNAFTLVELLVVIAIVGMLVSFLLPAVQAARATARRSQCSSNIRQLALAALNFESAKGHLPSSLRPAGLTPLPRISGMTLLLPYLEQGNRYDNYDQMLNWHAPENRPVVNLRIPVLECPASPRPERLDGLPEADPWEPGIGAITDFAATIYVDQRLESAGLVDKAGVGILERNAQPTLGAVTDGLSNTIMFAESAGRPYLYRQGKLVSEDLTQARVNGGGWCRPATEISIDGSSRDGLTLPGPCALNCTNGEDFAQSGFPHPYYGSFGSGEPYAFHNGGGNFAFGDASVHFLSDDVDIREFARLVTRSGGEVTPPVH
jgi:prepilin-type N-terminal cleavage/methylation domain-containing protein